MHEDSNNQSRDDVGHRTVESGKDGGIAAATDKKEQSSDNISWEELIFFVSQKWGLRHLDNIDTAKEEMERGIEDGDAVSLSYPNNFLSSDNSRYLGLEEFSNFSVNILPFTQIAQRVKEEDKEGVLASFREAVKQFIKDSVGMDINSIPSMHNLRTETVLDLLISTKLAFVLAEFPSADNPYDFDQYYNLGKCGKQVVAPEKMVALVSLQDAKEKIISDLDFSSDELKEKLSEEKFYKIIDVCAANVWDKILKMAKNKKLDSNS